MLELASKYINDDAFRAKVDQLVIIIEEDYAPTVIEDGGKLPRIDPNVVKLAQLMVKDHDKIIVEGFKKWSSETFNQN
jgi:hypothetical protein